MTAHELNRPTLCRRRSVSSQLPRDGVFPDARPLARAGLHEELDLEPDDFDVVFAYPWPGEEQVIFDLFADTAAVGSLLLTYHGMDGVRLQRKVKR